MEVDFGSLLVFLLIFLEEVTQFQSTVINMQVELNMVAHLKNVVHIQNRVCYWHVHIKSNSVHEALICIQNTRIYQSNQKIKEICYITQNRK